MRRDQKCKAVQITFSFGVLLLISALALIETRLRWPEKNATSASVFSSLLNFMQAAKRIKAETDLPPKSNLGAEILPPSDQELPQPDQDAGFDEMPPSNSQGGDGTVELADGNLLPRAVEIEAGEGTSHASSVAGHRNDASGGRFRPLTDEERTLKTFQLEENFNIRKFSPFLSSDVGSELLAKKCLSSLL